MPWISWCRSTHYNVVIVLGGHIFAPVVMMAALLWPDDNSKCPWSIMMTMRYLSRHFQKLNVKSIDSSVQLCLTIHAEKNHSYS